MIALFNRGYDLASHGYSWVKAPPGMELGLQAHDLNLAADRLVREIYQ